MKMFGIIGDRVKVSAATSRSVLAGLAIAISNGWHLPSVAGLARTQHLPPVTGDLAGAIPSLCMRA